MIWWSAPAFALTCDEIFVFVGDGVPEVEITERIKLGADMTLADLKCLTAGSASKVVVAAAERRVAKSAVAAPPPPKPSYQTGGTAPAPARSSAKRVDVEFVGAVFSPGKSDGTSWDMDGTGAAVVGTVGSIATIGNPVAGRLGQLGMAGLAAPDPTGFVTWLPASPQERSPLNRKLRLPPCKDTYRPDFAPAPRYRGVPLAAGTTFRVHLWDDDNNKTDAIQPVDVTLAALEDALAAGGVYAVPAGQQTNGDLQSVLIRVRPSSVSDLLVEGQPVP